MTVKIYSIHVLKSLSIHLVLAWMLIQYAYCDHKTEFINYFSLAENKFLATYSLSTLKQADRQNICNQLGRRNNYITNNEILLVSLRVRDLSMQEVPAFQCASNETSFYTTFVPPDLYFKLAFESFIRGPPYVIRAQITSSTNISCYADYQDNIHKEIYKYFKSTEYTIESYRVVEPYYQNNTWKDLCAMINIIIDENRQNNPSRTLVRSLTVKKKKITGIVPVVYCRTDLQYWKIVIYFTGGIFFTTHEDTELILNGVTLIRPDDESDVELATYPYFRQYLPGDLVDNISSRRRG